MCTKQIGEKLALLIYNDCECEDMHLKYTDELIMECKLMFVNENFSQYFSI